MKANNQMNTKRRYQWIVLAMVMMIALFGVQSANAEYDPNPPALSYPQDRILLRFEPIGAGEIIGQDDVLSAAGGGTIIASYEDIVPGLVLVELPAGKTVANSLNGYAAAAGIMYAEPDYDVLATATTPNDTFFSDLYGMHNTGQTGGTSDADIDAPEAWGTRTSASNIVVAVIDSGVDYDHEDLAGNMWTNTAELNGSPNIDDDNNGYVDDIYGYDFYNNDGDPDDDQSHGTHVSGTIGAIGNNSKGVVGVCWDVQIMAVKFLNSLNRGYTSGAIESIRYAIKMDADVMNNSWGGGGFSQALKDTIFQTQQEGILFVAAAGNGFINRDNDVTPLYPASYDLANIIAVAATDDDDNLASFSHFGATTVDLGAPGVLVKSCTPSNGYGNKSGTSMATPHVAGACALYLALNPGDSYTEVKTALLNSVDPISALTGKCVSEGRLNLDKLLGETPEQSNDINPATFNSWGSITDFMPFYMLDFRGDGYWGAKKYVKATFGLIDGHCTTAKGTDLPHYHFEANFNTIQRIDSNRYWDWYYGLIGGSSIRQSNATNTVASLASGLDGYGTFGAATATYNYWLVPSEETDTVTEDLIFWQGPPHDARAGDRILYNDNDFVFQHVTVIKSIDGNNEPDQIEWKCQHSGVYKWNNGRMREQFATPGCISTQPDGSKPSGTFDADFWDTSKANVYYD